MRAVNIRAIQNAKLYSVRYVSLHI